MIKKLILGLLLISLSFSITAIGVSKITYADALVSMVIAKEYSLPIIFLEKDRLSNKTINLLKKLNVSNLILVGGPVVISENVENELKNMGINVKRVWGITRYETSALLAKLFFNQSKEAVLITHELTNENKATVKDLLTVRKAISFAIKNNLPVLITPFYKLDESVNETLNLLGVKKVYLVTSFKLLTPISKLILDLNNQGISLDLRFSIKENCKKVYYLPEKYKNLDWKKIYEILVIPPEVCIKFGKVNKTPNIKELYEKFIEKEKEREEKIKNKIRNILNILEAKKKKILIKILGKKYKIKEITNNTDDILKTIWESRYRKLFIKIKKLEEKARELEKKIKELEENKKRKINKYEIKELLIKIAKEYNIPLSEIEKIIKEKNVSNIEEIKELLEKIVENKKRRKIMSNYSKKYNISIEKLKERIKKGKNSEINKYYILEKLYDLFKSAGYSDEEIKKKIEEFWNIALKYNKEYHIPIKEIFEIIIKNKITDENELISILESKLEYNKTKVEIKIKGSINYR